VLKETSAQVGRVATRLRISAVVATFAIITGAVRTPRLRRGYSRDNSRVLERSIDGMPHVSLLLRDMGFSAVNVLPRAVCLVPRQDKVDRDLSFHLDRLAVQNVRPVAPLADSTDRRGHEHRRSGQRVQVLHDAVLTD